MATEYGRKSGSYSTTVIGRWELVRQDIAGNYSVIRSHLYFYYGGSKSVSSSSSSFGTMGVTLYSGSYRFYPGETYLGYTDFTVNHNADGTFPATNIGFWAQSYHISSGEVWGTIYGYNKDNHPEGIPAIPRQASITSAPDFNDEGNPTVNYSNPAGTAVSQLVLGIYDTKGSVAYANYRDVSKTGTSYTFNLTNDERVKLRKACTGNSMQVNFYLRTTIGGTNYYSVTTKTMTIVNGNPTFSNFTFTDINSKTIALTGNNQNVIKGYSNIKVTIPTVDKAVAKKEATMNKYRFTCGDKNSPDAMLYSETDVVVGTINGTPNGTLNVYAIDSRNNSTLVTKLANQVIDYTPLTKGEIEIGRNNGVSEQVTLKFNGLINVINFGVKTNAIKSAKFRYKSTETGSEWSTPESVDVVVNNGTFSFEGLVKGDTESLGFDVANSYQVEVIVEDELSIVTYTDKFGSGTPNLALAKQGVGIMGKYDEEVGGKLQVAGENILKKKVATAYLSSEVSNIKNNWIPFNAITSNTNRLTLSNSGIRIGKGVSKVLVSGNVFLVASANNSYLWTATKKVSSNGNYNIGIAIDNFNTYFASTCHSPHIIDVVEGDIIKILKIDDNGGTIRANANTYLTVEVIEEDL